MPLKSLGLTDSATSLTARTYLRDAARSLLPRSDTASSVTIVDIAFFYINDYESINLLYRKPVCDHYSQTDLTFSRLLIKAAPKAHGYGQAGSLQFPESALEKARLWWQKTPL